MKLSDYQIRLLERVGVFGLVMVEAPLLIIGSLGIFAGLTTDAGYASVGFNIAILSASCIGIFLVFFCFKYRNSWWGKLLNILAALGFAFVGLVALGPV
jgi:hypothetical protein